MKISVVIPVFNTERYLRECVDSLITQTIFEAMELILVDDGSSDGSPQICDEYAGNFDNITVIHKQNAGVSAARNIGIDVARGDFIGFVDSDDTVYPDMYALLYGAAEKTGADMVFCGIEHPYPDKDVVIEYPFDNGVLLGREYIKNTVAPFMLTDSSFNSLCNKLFRRNVIEDSGLRLSDGKKQGEDRELVLKFLLACGGVCGVPYTGYFYRYVQSSAVQKPRCDYTDTIFEQHSLDRALFLELGVEPTLLDSLSTVSAVSELLCAIAFANKKLRGSDRRRVMRSIVKHEGTQKLVRDNYKLLIKQNTRFAALLIKAVRIKSISGVRLIMALMKIKVWAYAIMKGRSEI